MGAAANRIKNLAEGLKKNGNRVTVICPLPNYPSGKIFKGYKGKFMVSENINGIIIKRCWIFPSKSKNAFVRLLSMLSFAWSIWFNILYLLKNKSKVFIIQSPPLFVSFSALVLSKFLMAKNVLNVSDIWPLSALDLGVIKKGYFYKFLEFIERTNYNLADKIVGQSDETILHISRIVKKEFLVYRNVPKYNENAPKQKSKGNLKIVYAGLLGFAQGVLNICENIDFKTLEVEFHIYGAGMDEEKIKFISQKKNSNIFFHGLIKPENVSKEIIKYDVGLVPLKNKIYGAIPSKIFELMQIGIPILFFGEGEGAKIIKDESIGLSTNSDNLLSLKDKIIDFKNMEPKFFNSISVNAIKSHKKKYHLEIQLKKFNKILN